MMSDDESFDDDDLDTFGDDEPPEMICPKCRGIVSEETTKCPHCGDWITPVDPASSGSRQWMYVIAIIIMLLISLMWAF